MEKNLTEIGLEYGTDKAFWHRYTDFYEPFFARLKNRKDLTILEFGVLDGASIKMLDDYFHPRLVIGADIQEEREGWRKSENIIYRKVD